MFRCDLETGKCAPSSAPPLSQRQAPLPSQQLRPAEPLSELTRQCEILYPQFLLMRGRGARSSTKLLVMSEFLKTKEVVGSAPCLHLGVIGCDKCTFPNRTSSPPPPPPSPSNAAPSYSPCNVPCTDQLCPVHFDDLEVTPPSTPRPVRPYTPRPDTPTPSGPHPSGPKRDDDSSSSVRTIPTRYRYWREDSEERRYEEERQNVQNRNL